MRLVLVACLAVSLAPGLGEVAESVIHLAASGHLAHSDACDGGLDERGDEHGCSTTDHLCGCCPSQQVTPPPSQLAGVAATGPSGAAACATLASIHEPAPPFRPPIAS